MKLLVLAATVLLAMPAAARIDRHALVSRHDVRLTAIDPHAPLMVGNGELGFTADVTGLQTFPEAYAKQSPLLTMAQWSWHSFPNPHGWTEADGETDVRVPGRGVQRFAYVRDPSRMAREPALTWLRQNPHRFSLARIALRLVHADGTRATPRDLSAIDQRLDLWRGTIVSRFRFDGAPVEVRTRVDGGRDAILVDVRSPLIARGRIGVDVAFPGVGRAIDPDPSDWTHTDAHRTEIAVARPDAVLVHRTIDATRYDAAIAASGGMVTRDGPHGFRIAGRERRLAATVAFDRGAGRLPSAYDAAVRRAERGWIDYWRHGGAVDFSGSTDRRAGELERRVVLSQYLARINESGSVPPQEEGLFSNSWYGKFHTEMTIWHAAHFATWGRLAQLEPLLDWYRRDLPHAEARAAAHRVDGAWWPKMAGPDGGESPSAINPFIMWHQPHPIYLAELVRRARPDAATLARYGAIVDATARLLGSWPLPDGRGGYRLGPPIIPVQENHDPLTTRDPAFELEYWRGAIAIAQRWRMLRGEARRADWDAVVAGLPAPPAADGRYVPVAGLADFWRESDGRCRGDASPPGCLNRDHPSFLMPYGLIAGMRIDPATMRRSLAGVRADWDMRQLWGWDFPMIAMTAARLGDPADAIDWLFADAPNNRWGRTGMTPRFGFDPLMRGGEGNGITRAADTYFPSNGALLLAVGMMAAGWDGSGADAPGFPKTGWHVRHEGIQRLP